MFQDGAAVAFDKSAEHRSVAISHSAGLLRPSDHNPYARTPDDRQL
jgi:hypothetical protein